MPSALSFTIDASRPVAIVRYHEQPTFAEWSEIMDRLLSDAHCNPQLGVILDRRYVFFPADEAYIQQMVRYLDSGRAAGKLARCAIVVTDMGSYGMGRLAEQITNLKGSIQTFRNLHDAETWLAGEKP